jgi:ribonuclease E
MSKYEPASSGGPDVFAVHRIDEQLTKALDRKVWLPSGGTLVIDRTEAMTVVDVNTGKFTGSGGNLEQTVTRNNLEAAEETVRQLRLRDIGGMVVIDFIDMVLEANRDLVLRRLTEALGRDRTRHQVSEVTSLGLVQLTRKRLGTGLIEAFSTNCTHCAGRGIVLHADPVDTASSAGRSPEAGSGGRRGKRGKKGVKTEDVQVAKVPSHAAGEHPMFKAMAAANGRPEDEDDDESTEDSIAETGLADDAAEHVHHGHLDDDRDEDSTDAESDDEDSDEDSDEDDVDLVGDDEDEDIDDDDIEVIGDDSDDDDSDDDDSDDDDDDDSDDDDDDDVDDDDDDEDDEDDDEDDDGDDDAFVAVTSRPRRRRAAARPAGPPV